MKQAHSFSVRLTLTAAVFTLMAGVPAAFAQEPAKPQVAKGYADPEGVPVRPPAIDVEPVWARPAIDTVATIRKRGSLRVGVVPNEPFVMRNADGELAGFSIDLGKQLAADLGVDVTFVPTSWSQVVSDLVGNQFDVIASGLWVTPTRALVVNFSNPTSVGAVHLVANKTLASAMKTRQDFDRADVRLVVAAGTSQEALAGRIFPKATLIKVDGDTDPLVPVLDGKAHGVLVSSPAPGLFIDRTPDRLFSPLGEPLQTATTAMAVRKGDADFLNFLNSWLAFQAEGGWLTERQHYWFRTTAWSKGM
jgi:polar amino acid transport system substrate-binding protein